MQQVEWEKLINSVRENGGWPKLLRLLGYTPAPRKVANGRYLTMRCPFHSEKTASMHFDTEGDGTYICYGCQNQGDFFRFIRRVKDWSQRKVERFLRRHFST
ncbi:MAG: CHC2 zinc finger domain-containing protein [Patescibacteria group bacterium]